MRNDVAELRCEDNQLLVGTTMAVPIFTRCSLSVSTTIIVMETSNNLAMFARVVKVTK